MLLLDCETLKFTVEVVGRGGGGGGGGGAELLPY